MQRLCRGYSITLVHKGGGGGMGHACMREFLNIPPVDEPHTNVFRTPLSSFSLTASSLRSASGWARARMASPCWRARWTRWTARTLRSGACWAFREGAEQGSGLGGGGGRKERRALARAARVHSAFRKILFNNGLPSSLLSPSLPPIDLPRLPPPLPPVFRKLDMNPVSEDLRSSIR